MSSFLSGPTHNIHLLLGTSQSKHLLTLNNAWPLRSCNFTSAVPPLLAFLNPFSLTPFSLLCLIFPGPEFAHRDPIGTEQATGRTICSPLRAFSVTKQSILIRSHLHLIQSTVDLILLGTTRIITMHIFSGFIFVLACRWLSVSRLHNTALESYANDERKMRGEGFTPGQTELLVTK